MESINDKIVFLIFLDNGKYIGVCFMDIYNFVENVCVYMNGGIFMFFFFYLVEGYSFIFMVFCNV